jgi:hypothetical protein
MADLMSFKKVSDNKRIQRKINLREAKVESLVPRGSQGGLFFNICYIHPYI